MQRPFQLHGIHARFLGSACHHFFYLCARVAQHAARRAGNILQHAARGYVLRLGPGGCRRSVGRFVFLIFLGHLQCGESGARRYAKAQQAF